MRIRLGRRQEVEAWLIQEENVMSLYKERHLRTPQHEISRDRDEEELELLRSLRGHTEKKILCRLYQAELLIAAEEVFTAAY